MLVSYRWVRELTGLTVSADEIANRLTFSGLEVEGIAHVGNFSDDIVIGRIERKAEHPERDNLSVVTVNDGSRVHQVVCGAPNCPGPGGRVVLGRIGAAIGDVTLSSRKLAGVQSDGMLLSEDELGIGPDEDGILILDDLDVPLGTPITKALDLEDWIIDVAITPNRPDALSHRGIARELCLLYGKPYTPPDTPAYETRGETVSSLATVTIADPDLCPRYAATVVNDVTWTLSPFAIRYRIHVLGLRPISNLVDVTNLIMLEFGQPIHAFDLDTLENHAIVVRRATSGEKMATLDGVERAFDSGDLLICDARRPVAIAGVMGGDATGVSLSTKRVLIECAYFNPSTVRRTSKRLKLSTDAAYRFERGMDPSGVPAVLSAATARLAALSGGIAAPGVIDCYPKAVVPPTLTLRASRYKAIVGGSVSTSEMTAIMKGLGASATQKGETVDVVPPTSRPDIEREIDLIEEVVRIRGFKEVPLTTPKTACVRPRRDYFQAERRAKEILSTLGLQEAISYSFVDGDNLALLGAHQQVVDIANPLNTERASMRTTLLVGLLENLKRAQSRFLTRFAQFEVARTYHDTSALLPNEILKAAAVMSGPASTWIGEPARQVDFYDIKGVLETFLAAYCGADMVGFEPMSEGVAFHPKRALELLHDGKAIGYLGEVHPKVLSSLKLHRGVVAFEIDIYPLWQARKRPSAAALPEFPPMSRDVAFLVSKTQNAGDILSAFRREVGDLAEDVSIFDVYTGENIPEDKKSIAFSVVYRANDRTLTDKEVDKHHQSVVTALAKQFNAVQR